MPSSGVDIVPPDHAQRRGLSPLSPPVPPLFLRVVAELLLLIVCGTMLSQGFGTARPPHAAAQVDEIGRALLNPGAGGFVLPFEVISLVLVAALVGAITVAGKPGDDFDERGED